MVRMVFMTLGYKIKTDRSSLAMQALNNPSFAHASNPLRPRRFFAQYVANGWGKFAPRWHTDVMLDKRYSNRWKISLLAATIGADRGKAARGAPLA